MTCDHIVRAFESKNLNWLQRFFFSRKVVLDWMAEEDGKLANCSAAAALSCLDTEMVGWTQRGPNILYIYIGEIFLPSDGILC